MSFNQVSDPLVLGEDQEFPSNSPCGYFAPNPLPNQRHAANCGWNKGMGSKGWGVQQNFFKCAFSLFIFW